MADRIVVMSNGRIEQTGPPRDIYHRPENAFVADFIGKANFFDGVAEGGKVRVGATLLTLSPRANFLSGAPVRLACRPEKIDLEDNGGRNRLSATVTFVRDLGPVRDIHLETVIGKVVVEYALGESERPFHVGEQVTLTLPPEALLAFPRSETMAAE